jgi:phage RecT family recombinase
MQDNTPNKGDGLILAAKKTIAAHIADVTNHPDAVADSLATIARSTGATKEFATKFAAGALSYLSKHGEALAECTPQTFLGAIMALAQVELTLDPAAGLAYLLPFKRSKKVGVDEKGKDLWESTSEVQLCISYKGYITLMKRQYPKLHIDMQYILKGERYIYDLAQSTIVAHEANLDLRSLSEPAKYERMTFVYCKIYPYGAEKPNAYKEIEMMPFQDVERHRLMNKSQKDTYGKPLPIKDAWEKAPFSMAYAKLLRKVVKKHITIDPKGTPKESLAIDEDYTYSTDLNTDDAAIYSTYSEPPASEAEAVTPASLEMKTKAFFDALTAVAQDPTTTRANVHERVTAIYKEAIAFFGSVAQLPIGFIDQIKSVKNNAKEEAKTEGETNG